MESLQQGQFLNEGRYKISHEVNRGATAIVYEAKDTTNDNKVALKVMNATEDQQAMQLKMVKREVEYASSMTHPNIVRLLDVFAEGKQLILAWELIEGQDLLDLLNRVGGQMPEDMTAFYLHQILRGVAFMHEKAFCHRDLKPENCMVEKKTQILKIIDFGLSKHLDSVNTLGVGTPDYMSPEMLGIGMEPGQQEGPKYDAKAVDVWALGVTFYLLITGVYPFENPEHPNSLSHTLKNIRQNQIRALPSRVSSDCEALIRSLLSPSPKNRPQLKEIEENAWLRKNAKAYAQKIKRPELFKPMDSTTSTKSSPRVRFRESVIDIDTSLNLSCELQETRMTSQSPPTEAPQETTGCFGTSSTNKGRIFSFFKNLFR